MSSNVTQILNGVEANLVALYPTIPVRKRKGLPSGRPESALCGWTPADPCPCFVVTCPDPEPVDEFGSFEDICVRYNVLIAYVRSVQGMNNPREDDDDIRQKRQDIRDALYKPTLEGVAVVWGVGFKSDKPYTADAGSTPAVSVSTEEFQFLTNEPRGFN